MEGDHSQPQRELLQFPVNLEGLPEHVVEIIQVIKKVAEKTLYHWGSFPIIVPLPIAVVGPDGDGSVGKPKPLVLRELFVAPTFEELDAVALDSKGDSQPLNEKQLQSIRESGEFVVESMNFPGQVHRWLLSQLLQKGVLRIRKSFLKDIALAVRLIAITAHRRLHSHFFSISQSACALLQGFRLHLDACIGVPFLSTKHLDVRIREERSKYLVAELTVRPDLEDDLDNLCQFVKHQIRKQTMEKYRIENEKPPIVPYIYQTPKGLDLDLRLFNKDIVRKALPVLASILEKESKGWFIPFREKIVADLKAKKLTEEEVETKANMLVLDEYLRRVCATILLHSHIKEIGNGIGQLLVEQTQSQILMHRAVDCIPRKLSQRLAQLQRSLEEDHPILSLIAPWVREKLHAAEKVFHAEHQWDSHEEALHMCREHNLQQAAYFLHRDLVFMKEREPILKQELGRVCNPTRVFHWRTQVWCPHHWKVRKIFQGQNEVVPTVISHTSSSLAQPRSDPNQPVYLVDKQCTRTTTTRWPFWRWVNYCHRTWSWTWNAMFLFGVVIPWCSPVSLRALFSIRPFMPDLELNQIDGILYPRKTSVTHTLCSRLQSLWRHISKSRTEFESRPDTGFIGKGFSRHLNRVWNYLLKGALGTLLIVIIVPCICLTASSLSLILGLCAPFWIPALTLVFHLGMVLFYDFDSPESSNNKICILLEALVWHILIQGLIQPILAVIVALLFCPFLAFIVLIVAVVRYGFRMMWDGMIFNLLIKRRGRIPSTDSWLVWRISGPGLSESHYFQIRPEQALAAFEARIEVEELLAYKEQMERIILQPQLKYREFVHQCFHSFSAYLGNDGVYRQLDSEGRELMVALQDQVSRRLKDLEIGLTVSMRAKIKLSAPDLQVTIRQASIMLENIYPTHVLKRLHIQEEEFWEKEGLSFKNWAGLAAHMLAAAFSAEILTPLEDTDTYYRLEAHGVNLNRYTQMLAVAEQRVDIDVSHTVLTPKGKIRVHSPYLDLSTFNPLNPVGTSIHKKDKYRSFCGFSSNFADFFRGLRSQYPWKKRTPELNNEKLLIPLPLLHPAHIAVIIFNRENEDPIPLESEICQDILKAIEDGSKGSILFGYDNGTTPDDNSITTTGDEYQGVNQETKTATLDSDHFSQDSHTTYKWSRSQSEQLGGSIIVNLASSEDITLEPDDQRVTYSHSSYSTTV